MPSNNPAIPSVYVLRAPITNRFADLLSFIKSQTTTSSINPLTHPVTFIIYVRSTLSAQFFADLLEYHFDTFSDGTSPKVHRYLVKHTLSQRLHTLRTWATMSLKQLTTTSAQENVSCPSNILVCDELSVRNLFVQLPQLQSTLNLDWLFYYDLPACPSVYPLLVFPPFTSFIPH